MSAAVVRRLVTFAAGAVTAFLIRTIITADDSPADTTTPEA